MLDDEAAAQTAHHLFQRAYQLHQRGALADAMRLYQESIDREACHHAIALDPTFGNPYNDIGAYFVELGWWAQATPWPEQAITAPRYANREFAHFNLGWVHEHFGRLTLAARCYRTVVQLNPCYLPARQSYRLMLAKQN